MRLIKILQLSLEKKNNKTEMHHEPLDEHSETRRISTYIERMLNIGLSR